MAKRKIVRRRRVSRKRSTGVAKRRSLRSNGLSMAGIKGGLLNLAKGAIGGLVYGFAAQMLDPQGNDSNKRIAAGIGAGFLVGVLAKQPLIGAGCAGALALGLGRQYGLLKDDSDLVEFVRPDTLMQRAISSDPNSFALSEYQDESGNVMYALADGSFTSVYPNYLNPGFY